MDIRQLEIFCKVADLKSFSKAARAVYLSQPTASGHIQSLEAFLGVKLFDRLGREVSMTKAGRVLYDYAKRILEVRAEAMGAIEEYLGVIGGSLLVGASTIPGGYLLPGVVGQFRGNHPEALISVAIRDTQQVAEGVLNGDFELGVIGAKLYEGRLEYGNFTEDELILAVPPSHPWAGRRRIEPKQLLEGSFIRRELGSGTRTVTEGKLREVGVEADQLKVVAEMGGTESVRNALRAGLGAAIISRVAVEEDLRSGSLVEVAIEGVELRRDFHVVSHKGRSFTPLCKAFREFLLQWES